MNIVITGAAGYIGTMLVNTLTSGPIQHKISCFDNFFWNQEKFVTWPLSKVDFYREDINQWSDNLKRKIEEAEVIIPLAALVGAPLCDKYPDLALQTNQLWFDQLLSLLNDQLVIFPNTNSSYGSQTEICTEQTPLNPLSLYARTKNNAESIIKKYHNHVIFRLATVFGMSFRPRLDLLVNNLTAIGVKEGKLEIFEGHFQRNYIHVKDVALAVDNARLGFIPNGVYNLGNDGINMSKWELAVKISQEVGCWLGATVGSDRDQRNYIVSSQKLYNTGFNCKYSLEYGIKEIQKFVKLGIDDPCFRNY